MIPSQWSEGLRQFHAVRGTLHTPWGQAGEACRVRGSDIFRVSTPSHGGFFVPAHIALRIPMPLREWAMSWSGSPHWYEEDCCWAALAIVFPGLFPMDRECAELTLASCGIPLP